MDEERYTRITLRLPKQLHEQLAAVADAASRSMNAEMVARLDASFQAPAGRDAIRAQIADVVRITVDELQRRSKPAKGRNR